jgi:hypothetical protein
MAGQAGFLYEAKIQNLFKRNKIAPAGFKPAASDPNAPDAMFLYMGKPYKLEVKLDPKVDYGQGSLDYDLKKDKWILGGQNTPAAKQMREFLESLGVLKLINSAKGWGGKGPPRKFTVPLSQYKKQDVDYDYKHFKDRFIDIPNYKAVADYYNTKDTYYIQIGKGYGLYHMGKDIANIGTTEFKPKLRIRIRLKRGGSNPIYNYRFSTAIQSASVNKSEVDLDDKEFAKAFAARAKSIGK